MMSEIVIDPALRTLFEGLNKTHYDPSDMMTHPEFLALTTHCYKYNIKAPQLNESFAQFYFETKNTRLQWSLVNVNSFSQVLSNMKKGMYSRKLYYV
jgi:hypothetical protein